MSSGYGSHRWTCGECRESYEASGVVADLKVDRWARDHREMHRVEKMTEADRDAYYERKMDASMCLLGHPAPEHDERRAST